MKRVRARTSLGASSKSIGIGVVLFLGLLVVATGYFSNNHLVLYSGLLITLAGSILGVLRLIGNGNSR